MNESENESIETELRRLMPARLPEDFAQRLAAAPPGAIPPAVASRERKVNWLRWAIPTTAAAAALLGLFLWTSAPDNGLSAEAASAVEPVAFHADDVEVVDLLQAILENLVEPVAFHADDVEINRRLVDVFETVATLPNGEPVRVEYREWMDEIVLRDTERGVAIQQLTPRFEVVPVGFETF